MDVLRITILAIFWKLYPKNKNRKQVFLLGNFNINLLSQNDHQPTNDFLDSLASNFFISYILHPNRITSYSKTLIDNIFSNFISPDIISGDIIATVSEHLPQFSFVPNILSNLSTQESNYYERHFSKFKQENFNLTILIKIGLTYSKLINKMLIFLWIFF